LSKELQPKLTHLIGISGSLYQSKGNFSRLRFSVVDSWKLYKFMYNGNIEANSGLYLGRKKKVFDKFMSLRS